MQRRRKASASTFRPRSLQAAAQQNVAASFVLISVPGRYAAGVANDALDMNKHVFLYSDNVSIEDEISLKARARDKGLLVMGPDCGTAIISGIGLGFANRVRRGEAGLVGASGTGLQAISSRIHQLGGGISQAIGTGGRDLKLEIKAVTTLQGLELLADDSETAVIVLVSKPPEPEVAVQVIAAARAITKPVVICFIGQPVAFLTLGNIRFAANLNDAADIAVRLLEGDSNQEDSASSAMNLAIGESGFLRGLFSGGTLAYEVVLGLQSLLVPLYTNAPIYESQRLGDVNRSQGHTILDMGEDDFTQGRLHPMMNNDLRIRRMLMEAADPQVSIILFDLVLGEGAHPDPATELAAAVRQAKQIAAKIGKPLEVIALIVGTDEDPQNIVEQESILTDAGVVLFHETSKIIDHIARKMPVLSAGPGSTIEAGFLHEPLSVINVGLEIFTDSLQSQGAAVIHVDWRPPAGGNEQLISILAKMRSTS